MARTTTIEIVPSKSLKFLLAVAVTTAIFAAVAALLLRVLPAPHREIDYLVTGAVATFAAMVALFVMLARTFARGTDLFYKRKQAAASEQEPEAESQPTGRTSTSE